MDRRYIYRPQFLKASVSYDSEAVAVGAYHHIPIQMRISRKLLKSPSGTSSPSLYFSTQLVTTYTTATEQSIYAAGPNTSAAEGFASRLFSDSLSPSVTHRTLEGEPTDGATRRYTGFGLAGNTVLFII